MAETISVVENTRPKERRILRQDVRDQSAGSERVDITGYVFKLIVKSNVDLPDSRAFFDLAATLFDAVNGVYDFDFTIAHTGLAPRSYPGEIRYWDDGDETKQPTDRILINYVVEGAVQSVL